MTEKTLVFVGPTLSGRSEFKKSVSDKFIFHPPVSCGNLLEAYREGFRKFLIVDGYFENIQSVWHKEILYVLDRGACVVGCSSMGALRAYELEAFGMIGAGAIFDDYKNGKICDDDEVTVAHLDEVHEFVPVSDAMVNIRYTLDDAVANKVLEVEQAARILNVAKAAFYKRRKLVQFVGEAIADEKVRNRFFEYLSRCGQTDRKAEDAVDVLRRFDSLTAQSATKQVVTGEKLSNTTMLQNLHYFLNVSPPSLNAAALSHDSRVLKLSRLLFGKQYKLLSELAGAMMQFSKIVIPRSTPTHVPISWLDERALAEKPEAQRLIDLALQSCPEYLNTNVPPMSVRHLALSIDFPIEYLEFRVSEGSDYSLSANSLANYSLLLWLTGLFLDAREKEDPILQRLNPTRQSIENRMLQLARRGLDTVEKQKAFLTRFGLVDLEGAARALEKLSLVLSGQTIGLAFGFLQEGTYWYELAVRAGGIWPQLKALTDEHFRASFCRELSEMLNRLPPKSRVNTLILHELDPNLLSAESIQKYINDELAP